MNKIIYICLIILFCFSFSGCGTEEENMLKKYDFYNANYGDSIEAVKSIEGLEFVEEKNLFPEDEDVFETPIENPYETIIICSGKFFDLDCDFHYYFLGDTPDELKLTLLQIILKENEILYNTDKSADLFERLSKKFNKVYGKPKDDFGEFEELKQIKKIYASKDSGATIEYTTYTDNSQHDEIIIRLRKIK